MACGQVSFDKRLIPGKIFCCSVRSWPVGKYHLIKDFPQEKISAVAYTNGLLVSIMLWLFFFTKNCFWPALLVRTCGECGSYEEHTFLVRGEEILAGKKFSWAQILAGKNFHGLLQTTQHAHDAVSNVATQSPM